MSRKARAAAQTACLVLMLKAPARSKRRLAGQIGAPADTLAGHLLGCVAEDVADWDGPVCYAPATAEDAAWLAKSQLPRHRHIVQPAGNLGERIAGINRSLAAAGHAEQIFIGIDCPSLDPAYLAAAARSLAAADIVLGPASDGGVVLMGVRGLWPDLSRLPWSDATLGRALESACSAAGMRTALLPTRDDLDSAEDFARVRSALANDRRPARRALRAWLEAAGRLPRDVPA